MAIQYSIQKMVSDGTLSTIALGIQYLQRNDIYMRVAGEETPQSGALNGYTWYFVDNTTIKILPVVPNGVEVVVYRRTDVDAMYNIYSQNAQFDEATIDENNQQLLYIAQEYLEQGIPGAGVESLEYINTVLGINYYRFRLTDGTYTPAFGVPDGTDVLRSDLNANGGAGLVRTSSGMTVQEVIDKGVRVVNVTPNTGADVTSLMQAEFNLAGAMFIPEGEYMIKAHTDSGGYGGVFVRNDSLIIFHPKAVFKAITNDKPAYAILNFQSVSNITVIEPKLIGDNDTHTGSTGEFGMGLYIRNSNNIHVVRPNIAKCWGDGIYIGQVGDSGTCNNVVIDYPVIDSCRRQGISVISADGLTINNPVISNIRGTLPSAGIDIEPNNAQCTLSRIKINNLKTTNTVSGLWIDLRVFTDGVATKTVDIEVNGHTDEGSDTGATFTRNLHPTYGSIKYNTPILRNNKYNGVQVRRWDSQGVNVEIDNPVVINPNRGGGSAVLTGAGISCYTLDTDESPTNGSGNVTLINPRVIFEPGITPAFPTQIAFRDSKSLNVDRVKILGMVDNPATFLELPTGVNESTCEITTSKNVRYKGSITSLGRQNFGFMGKFSGSVDTTGLTSKAVIELGSLGSQWHQAVIRVGVMCCAQTTGTPAANSIGYAESIITLRHKTAAVPVGTNRQDIITNVTSVISVAYFDSPPRAEVTVTMQASGNRVGWDIEAGGTAGAPKSIILS